MNYPYTLTLKVRDYECDMQGIVNNSVYMNYLEHARHEFLLEHQVNFAQLTEQGIHLVVTQVSLNYKTSLKSGDKFWVGVSVRRQGRLRFEFQQDIYRSSDDALVLTGVVTGTALNAQGKPFFPEPLSGLFTSSISD